MGLRLLRDESMKHQSATQAPNFAYPSCQHHHIFKHCSSCGAHRGRSLAAARPHACAPPCNRMTILPHKSNRNPVSALYIKSALYSTPLKGGLFPIKSMRNCGTFGAVSTVGWGGWCGDYNANFSIVGRVVLLHPPLRCRCGSAACQGNRDVLHSNRHLVARRQVFGG